MAKEGSFHSRRWLFVLIPVFLAIYSMVKESQVVKCDESTVELRNSTSWLGGIVWLASFPNSGTSYTMTAIERSSNLSTATNYGVEVTAPDDKFSLPIDLNHPEGPYWEGLSGKLGAIRELPDKYIMTKTHCRSRCTNCGAAEYVQSVEDFLRDCERTSAMIDGHRYEDHMNASRVRKIIHLYRHPLHNVVARYHLDRKHFVAKSPDKANGYPFNQTGFARWCRDHDDEYIRQEYDVLDEKTIELMRPVPCRGEFYQYVQWHNHMTQVIHRLPLQESMVLFYEDYEAAFNSTLDGILEFLKQKFVGFLRPFRPIPRYEVDHYTERQRTAIAKLIHHLADDEVWRNLQRYF